MRGLQFIAVLVFFWVIFLTVIFRLEKLMVWPYGDFESSAQPGDLPEYSKKWMESAIDGGFTFLQWAVDMKGPAYRVTYAMLVSPERDVFAIIGAGTVAKMPVAATWLYTPTSNGQCFYSSDKQSGIKLDVSGNWKTQLAPARDFQELLQKHRSWVRSQEVLPFTFTPACEIVEFRRLREEHYRSMEHAGLISYTDAAATHFRFTLSGAAKTATLSYLLGMVRQVTNGKFPQTA